VCVCTSTYTTLPCIHYSPLKKRGVSQVREIIRQFANCPWGVSSSHIIPPSHLCESTPSFRLSLPGILIQVWQSIKTKLFSEILECFQSKTLCVIVDAPWYVPNTVIRRDMQIATVKAEICLYSSQYSACLSTNPNDLVVNLMEPPDKNRRLQRHLPTRFLV
jgi:hypothetical protein